MQNRRPANNYPNQNNGGYRGDGKSSNWGKPSSYEKPSWNSWGNSSATTWGSPTSSSSGSSWGSHSSSSWGAQQDSRGQGTGPNLDQTERRDNVGGEEKPRGKMLQILHDKRREDPNFGLGASGDINGLKPCGSYPSNHS